MKVSEINLGISCHCMFPFNAGLFSCLKYKWPQCSQPHRLGLHYNSTRRSHMPPSFPASHLCTHTHTKATLPPTFAHYHMRTFVCIIYTTYRCLSCMLIHRNPVACMCVASAVLAAGGSVSEGERFLAVASMKIHDCYLCLNCEQTMLNLASTGRLLFNCTNSRMYRVPACLTVPPPGTRPSHHPYQVECEEAHGTTFSQQVVLRSGSTGSGVVLWLICRRWRLWANQTNRWANILFSHMLARATLVFVCACFVGTMALLFAHQPLLLKLPYTCAWQASQHPTPPNTHITPIHPHTPTS